MLQALKGLPEVDARLILSEATNHFLPRMRELGSRERKPRKGHVDAILDELKARTRRNPTAEQAAQEAIEILSEAYSALILPTAEKPEIKEKLGAEGKLPTRLYQIRFSPKFEEKKRTYLVSNRHVERAILMADEVQHLETAIADESFSKSVSSTLFLQYAPFNENDYSVLVKCDRTGSLLVVDNAFRIYHDEIDFSDNPSPVNVLERFAEKFGLLVRLEQFRGDEMLHCWEQKFFNQLIIDCEVGDSVRVYFSDGGRAELTSPEAGPVEVGLTYSIEDRLYVEQLRRHGLDAPIQAGKIDTSLILRNVPKSALRHR